MLAKAKSSLPRFPKIDKRLLGTWKSDRRRTFAEWNWKENTSSEKKNKIKSFFGKLEVSYARSKVVFKLGHRKWEQSRRYAVLATDETSVAIISFGELEEKNRKKYWVCGLQLVKELNSKPSLQLIHFDKKHYWISLGNGKNREFFQKIRSGK